MELSAISKKVGTMVLMGVPAIIGGALVYNSFDSFIAVGFYELILGFTWLGFISK